MLWCVIYGPPCISASIETDFGEAKFKVKGGMSAGVGDINVGKKGNLFLIFAFC